MTTDRGSARRFLAWCWMDIRQGETIDLWLLVAASLIFTVLGATGIASIQVTSSVVLALLALLAISQIRGRQEIRGLVTSWQRSRTSIFEADFPDAYYAARSRASQSYSFAGMTMQRTFSTMRPDLIRILDNNGTVRILLPDPSNQALMEMVAASRRYGETASDMSDQVRQSIATAKGLRGTTGRGSEVKVISLLPRVGLNVIDGGLPDALLMVQLYQIHPKGEPGPIFVLTPSDREWFTHFHNEFEQLWNSGTVC
jgi:hypothetical protein